MSKVTAVGRNDLGADFCFCRAEVVSSLLKPLQFERCAVMRVCRVSHVYQSVQRSPVYRVVMIGAVTLPRQRMEAEKIALLSSQGRERWIRFPTKIDLFHVLPCYRHKHYVSVGFYVTYQNKVF